MTARPFRFGSLFSGLGGLDLGLERAGMTCAWQVEIDPFNTRVLRRHWPDIPKYGDIRDVTGAHLEPVDLVCAGLPCQPHSLAGRRGSSDDARDLWSELARILRECRPGWLLVENVPGLLTSDDPAAGHPDVPGAYFGRILSDLAEIGYDAEWFVLSACTFGFPHARERLFLVAYPHGVHPRQRRRLTLPPDRQTQRHLRLWPGQPEPVRVAAGLPDRLERNHALGNAVVPQVAEWIGHLILHAHHTQGA